MPDMASISAALASLNAATDIVKGLRAVDRAIAETEVKIKLVDVLDKLTDARMALATLQEEVLARDRQIRGLQEKLDTRAKMVYSQPAYWQEKDGQRDGPFCPQCYDSAGKVIRLQPAESGVWTCKTCGQVFVERGRRESRQTRANTEWDPFRPD